jgi:hypothetical protein
MTLFELRVRQRFRLRALGEDAGTRVLKRALDVVPTTGNT